MKTGQDPGQQLEAGGWHQRVAGGLEEGGREQGQRAKAWPDPACASPDCPRPSTLMDWTEAEAHAAPDQIVDGADVGAVAPLISK